MRIGIDASRYSSEKKTGVEQYSKYIIDELIDLAMVKKKHSLELYAPEEIKIDNRYKNILKVKVLKAPRLWTQVRLSAHMIKNAPDVLFVPSHTMPFIHAKKTIVTIHDTAFRYFKKAYTNFQFLYLHLSTMMAAKKAYKIIVPSEATKKDLMGFYHCPEEKIEVIYHGLNLDENKSVTEVQRDEILNKFGLDKDDNYLLFIGRLESKKNLSRLIEAFSSFSKKHKDWKLVLAGHRGVGFNTILETFKRTKLKNKILMPGYIDEVEKKVLLESSKLFVFPSLYEGFGMPVLEAFASKIPVLCSNVSALREIAFDAAYLINPLEVYEIEEGMEKICFDEDLKRQLIEKGSERVKKFNWGKSGRETWRVLNSKS